MNIFWGIMIPFFGTTAGAGWVFLLGRVLRPGSVRALSGAAAGVMTAAAVFSLLLPAIQRSAHLGSLAFLPATAGFLLGAGFLMGLDRLVPRLKDRKWRTDRAPFSMLALAVTLHNIPEGMAVGAAFAGALAGTHPGAHAGAMALSLGIAVQNIPEGAILSLPLKSRGTHSTPRAFLIGTLSGAVEPAAAAFTLALARFVAPALPLLLAFAAGSMLYAVIGELIPAALEDPRGESGKLGFALGFAVMMVLDVALG